MLILYLSIGVAAGLLSGLLGIGGGVIVIPALSLVLQHYGLVTEGSLMRTTVATSVAIMIVTLSVSSYTHYKHKAVQWSMLWQLLPGLAIGAIVGALLTQIVPSNFLRILFGLFLCTISFKMLWQRRVSITAQALSLKSIRIFSLIIGSLSGLLGIGGGAMLVPFLLRCNFSIGDAIGTSAAAGLGIGIAATATFAAKGAVFWPAFWGIAFASALCAPLGVILTHRLPRLWVQRFFGVFVLCVAFSMIFS